MTFSVSETVELSRWWWTFILRGLLAIAFGILAFLAPVWGIAILVALFGAWALIDGVGASVTAAGGVGPPLPGSPLPASAPSLPPPHAAAATTSAVASAPRPMRTMRSRANFISSVLSTVDPRKSLHEIADRGVDAERMPRERTRFGRRNLSLWTRAAGCTPARRRRRSVVQPTRCASSGNALRQS